MIHTTPELCIVLFAVLLLGVLLGVALAVHGGAWVARTLDRVLVPIPMSHLTHRVRAIVKRIRAHPVPMHTHTNIRYKGVLHGYLQLPAQACPCGKEQDEENPYPPGPGGTNR